MRLKEIAHVLDCLIGRVKSRLHYGRELLRGWLAGEAAPRARSGWRPFMTRLRRGEDGFDRAIVQTLRASLCGEEPSPRVRDGLLRAATERMHAIRDAEGTLAPSRLWREADLYHVQSLPPDSARVTLETRRVMLALV